MKRFTVLIVALALMLSLLAGCGTAGRYNSRYDDRYRDGSNVSTTDDGTVNGVNPDVEGPLDGVVDEDGAAGSSVTSRAGTNNH